LDFANFYLSENIQLGVFYLGEERMIHWGVITFIGLIPRIHHEKRGKRLVPSSPTAVAVPATPPSSRASWASRPSWDVAMPPTR
jgi:hypothetical protein